MNFQHESFAFCPAYLGLCQSAGKGLVLGISKSVRLNAGSERIKCYTERKESRGNVFSFCSPGSVLTDSYMQRQL